jgi:hypothetical protein
MAEHHLYLPSFGFSLALAVIIEDAFLSRRTAPLALTALLLILALFSWRIIERNKDWKDEFTLWEKTVRTNPKCARALNNSRGLSQCVRITPWLTITWGLSLPARAAIKEPLRPT